MRQDKSVETGREHLMQKGVIAALECHDLEDMH